MHVCLELMVFCPFNTGLESPEQHGKTERKGGKWKKVAKRLIQSEKLDGEDAMRMLASSDNSVINDGARKGGFAPSQWVLGKFPRSVGDVFDADEFADIGLINEKVDASSAFYS